MKAIFLTLLILAAGHAKQASACSDYGCDSWGGLQETGGYNLSSFGFDLYNIGSSYDYGGDYGGSCGSFVTTCGGGYESADLYGSDWGTGSSGVNIDIGIDISIFPLSGGADWMNGGYNPYMGGLDTGCSIGYCDGGYYPYDGSEFYPGNPWSDPWSDYLNFPPTYGGFPRDPSNPNFPNPYNPNNPPIYYPQIPGNPYTYYPMPHYPPNYGDYPRDPSNPFDPNPFNPNPPFTPPPTTYPPPYGMCDDVIIPCPRGPITRNPNPLPRRRYDIPRDPRNPIDPGTPTHGNPPGTNPPVFYPPVNNPPTNNPPITNPPIIYPPVNFPPVNNPPVTYPPVNFPPPTGNPPGYPPVNPPPQVTYPQNPPPPSGGSSNNNGSRPPQRGEIPRG